MRFIPYSPDQGYLLPPHVQDVLGDGHLCFFVRRVVERIYVLDFGKLIAAGPVGATLAEETVRRAYLGDLT